VKLYSERVKRIDIERGRGKGKGIKKNERKRDIIIERGKGRRSEIFQTPFLRRQDLDWQQPLSKWTRSRGVFTSSSGCVPFFPFLPLSSSSSLTLPFPSKSLFPHPRATILYSPAVHRASLPQTPYCFFLFISFSRLNFIDMVTNTASGIQDLSDSFCHLFPPFFSRHYITPWPFHTSPLRLTRVLLVLLVSPLYGTSTFPMTPLHHNCLPIRHLPLRARSNNLNTVGLLLTRHSVMTGIDKPLLPPNLPLYRCTVPSIHPLL